MRRQGNPRNEGDATFQCRPRIRISTLFPYYSGECFRVDEEESCADRGSRGITATRRSSAASLSRRRVKGAKSPSARLAFFFSGGPGLDQLLDQSRTIEAILGELYFIRFF